MVATPVNQKADSESRTTSVNVRECSGFPGAKGAQASPGKRKTSARSALAKDKVRINRREDICGSVGVQVSKSGIRTQSDLTVGRWI